MSFGNKLLITFTAVSFIDGGVFSKQESLESILNFYKFSVLLKSIKPYGNECFENSHLDKKKERNYKKEDNSVLATAGKNQVLATERQVEFWLDKRRADCTEENCVTALLLNSVEGPRRKFPKGACGGEAGQLEERINEEA
uniref:Uncharacterized protein n=1 Tax=Rhodnius prolixus TaxID=13249 RepID=T1I9I8_RHOPR